ncbi:uncharacterized protein LOC120766455 [Bactrocera tryoni]|uniref:uncharacterized protein LOC120766455 n=1 Tax=Bactrocera tryoni TaxID=59916 RepID=UPI001A96D5B5|nr:uncharacterized protein LOC120766455 [Bactrocera tryoni]
MCFPVCVRRVYGMGVCVCVSRLATAQDIRYLHDLNTQMSVKRQTTCAEQQNERELCSKHFETFDTFWGRPGHGAPVEVTAKQKLDNLLYGASNECWN